MIALVGSERIGALLRKEKDETSPPKLFFGGFVEFPPFLVCEVWRFFVFKFRLRAGLSIVKTVRVKYFPRTKLKDQSMKKIQLFVLALAGFVVTSRAADGFADSVVSYDPGTGYVAGFTNVSAVLGEPSTTNPYGEATDVFDPPYGTNQILSIGAGGSLTVEFKRPILNHPHNPFGIDFIIFGNAGFIITNDFDFTTFDWVGTPATDGSLFGENDGQTRVSVSRDGREFYVLNPALAPTVDGFSRRTAAGIFTRRWIRHSRRRIFPG